MDGSVPQSTAGVNPMIPPMRLSISSTIPPPHEQADRAKHLTSAPSIETYQGPPFPSPVELSVPFLVQTHQAQMSDLPHPRHPHNHQHHQHNHHYQHPRPPNAGIIFACVAGLTVLLTFLALLRSYCAWRSTPSRDRIAGYLERRQLDEEMAHIEQQDIARRMRQVWENSKPPPPPYELAPSYESVVSGPELQV
ncbi:hypothetical protein BXZ70DRAFT_338793 [Cristinia sonorae]|uniref:Uncharacterized protein n=1 Tax=Cristinia sonorae TaxID=1940300 RepID=A0A8K0UJQ3_9AGAR|nr:hypothetical protein BXZ70DRAFT_338793 [Cristinia sonorae]